MNCCFPQSVSEDEASFMRIYLSAGEDEQRLLPLLQGKGPVITSVLDIRAVWLMFTLMFILTQSVCVNYMAPLTLLMCYQKEKSALYK